MGLAPESRTSPGVILREQSVSKTVSSVKQRYLKRKGQSVVVKKIGRVREGLIERSKMVAHCGLKELLFSERKLTA